MAPRKSHWMPSHEDNPLTIRNTADIVEAKSSNPLAAENHSADKLLFFVSCYGRETESVSLLDYGINLAEISGPYSAEYERISQILVHHFEISLKKLSTKMADRRRVAPTTRESECESEHGEANPSEDLSEYESANEESKNEDDDEETTDSSEEGETTDGETEDGEYTDSVIVEGEYEEGWVGEERQSGDGQEQPELATDDLDDDEDRKNPAYVPRKGAFYEHDLRIDETEGEGGEERPKKKLWKDDGKWLHDRFSQDQQAPKSRDELIALYGYDIRAHDKPPDRPPRMNKRRSGNPRDQKNELGDFISDRPPPQKDRQQYDRRRPQFSDNRSQYDDNRPPYENNRQRSSYQNRQNSYNEEKRGRSYQDLRDNRSQEFRNNRNEQQRSGGDRIERQSIVVQQEQKQSQDARYQQSADARHRESVENRKPQDSRVQSNVSAEGERKSFGTNERKNLSGERKGFDGERKGYGGNPQRAFDGERRGFNNDQKGFDSERKGFDSERKGFDSERRGYDVDWKAGSGEQKRFGERGGFGNERKGFPTDEGTMDHNQRINENRSPGVRNTRRRGGPRLQRGAHNTYGDARNDRSNVTNRSDYPADPYPRQFTNSAYANVPEQDLEDVTNSGPSDTIQINVVNKTALLDRKSYSRERRGRAIGRTRVQEREGYSMDKPLVTQAPARTETSGIPQQQQNQPSSTTQQPLRDPATAPPAGLTGDIKGLPPPVMTGKVDPGQSRSKRYSTQRQRPVSDTPYPDNTPSPVENQGFFNQGFRQPAPLFRPDQQAPVPAPVRGPRPRQDPPFPQPPAILRPPIHYPVPVSSAPMSNPPRLYTGGPPVSLPAGQPLMPPPYMAAGMIYGAPPYQMPAPVPVQNFSSPPPVTVPVPVPVQQPVQLPGQPSPSEVCRGGTTYYAPQLQQTNPNRSPVRRPKHAIPIIRPQDNQGGELDGELSPQYYADDQAGADYSYEEEQPEGAAYYGTDQYPAASDSGETHVIATQSGESFRDVDPSQVYANPHAESPVEPNSVTNQSNPSALREAPPPSVSDISVETSNQVESGEIDQTFDKAETIRSDVNKTVKDSGEIPVTDSAHVQKAEIISTETPTEEIIEPRAPVESPDQSIAAGGDNSLDLETELLKSEKTTDTDTTDITSDIGDISGKINEIKLESPGEEKASQSHDLETKFDSDTS